MSDTLLAAQPESGAMTHKQLCRRMALWLKNNRGYSVVVTERSTAAMETPDVLGFQSSKSLLIECKVSRSDFLADRQKSFRVYAERGMGDLRYFAAPPGIIKLEDLPANWGLLEVRDKQVRQIVEAQHQDANKRAEVAFLVSAIRRLEIAGTVFVRHEEKTEDCRPSDQSNRETFLAQQAALVGDQGRRITELEDFVREVRDNFDCDTGANGSHPHYCRCCRAKSLLELNPLNRTEENDPSHGHA